MQPCPIDHITTPAVRISCGKGMVLLILFLWMGEHVFAQCVWQERRYATVQQNNGGVDNPALAADGNITTASTLNAPLLGSVTQYLKFSTTITAGTPVTIKLTRPSGLLGVGTGITIQPFTNLKFTPDILGGSWSATNAGQSWTDGNLLGLLSGSGEMEVTFTPQTNVGPAVAFDGVAVTLGGISLGQSMNLFDAYIMQPSTTVSDCNMVLDVLSGVRAANLAVATTTSSVANPRNAVDVDPGFTTYATMTTGVQVLSTVFETVIFNRASVAGDSIRIVLQNPDIPLLNLGLLTGFSIQPYLGTTAVGSPITNTSSLLNLQLLSGSGNIYILTAGIPGSFDRVEIRMDGVVGALKRMYIYDVSRRARFPDLSFTVNGQPGLDPVCINAAGNMRFTVSAPESCATYYWYNASDVQAGSGSGFTPVITAPGTYTYSVAASRTGCTYTEAKKSFTFTVSPVPGKPALSIQP